MPSATTTKSLPYPLGADRLMDGDDQIRKLAQSVDNMVQAGAANVNVTTGGSYSTLSVTFPVAYSAAPIVVATPQGSSPNIGGTVAAAPSSTSVVIGGLRGSAGIQVVYWQAVGPVVAVA